MKTGMQLYCIKNVLEQDFAAGIRLAARAGYDGLEVYHLYDGIRAIDYRKAINAAGAVCCGSHNHLTRLKNLDELMEYNYALGNDTIISHWLFPEERDTLNKVCAYTEYLNEMGVVLRRNGFKLLYHNHDFEFRETLDGKRLMDIILENTDPLLVGIEFHAAQVMQFGIDPVAYARSLGQRLKYLHLSFEDMQGGPAVQTCEQVMEVGREVGAEWAVFEHVYPADVTEEKLMEDARRFKRMACAI